MWPIRVQKFEAQAAADRERFESEGGKAKKDTSGPKKPSSSYIHFWLDMRRAAAVAPLSPKHPTLSPCSSDKREAVKAANPGLVAKEILVELGVEWKKLSKEEKKARGLGGNRD